MQLDKSRKYSELLGAPDVPGHRYTQDGVMFNAKGEALPGQTLPSAPAPVTVPVPPPSDADSLDEAAPMPEIKPKAKAKKKAELSPAGGSVEP